ncbi:MAG: hypothetical protein JSW62_04805 [Thermoplasmatales archaeon]|nr:MAG: hypothetical protein JSW62_04805 [Thermoplasmatales archaeon]
MKKNKYIGNWFFYDYKNIKWSMTAFSLQLPFVRILPEISYLFYVYSTLEEIFIEWYDGY